MTWRPDVDDPRVDDAIVGEGGVPAATVGQWGLLDLPVVRRRRRGRCVAGTALAIVLGLLVLIPPFTPPTPWRFVTDRVPWQVVARVPWAYYPRVLSHVSHGGCNDVNSLDGHFVADHVSVEAFGREWASGGLRYMVGATGSFHELDRNHAVFIPDGTNVRIPMTPGFAVCFA